MKEDARKLSSQVQEEKRKQAIRLQKKGLRYKEIAELVGVHFETIGKWVRAYKANGAKGITIQARGRKTGSGRALTPGQEREIQCHITDKTPDQLKMVYALWTRKAVKELIEDTIRTVGDYLAQWGFTPQKPLKRAYERSKQKPSKKTLKFTGEMRRE